MSAKTGKRLEVTLTDGTVTTAELMSRTGSIDGKRRFRLDAATGSKVGGRIVDELQDGRMIVDTTRAGFVGASGATHYAAADDETPDTDCIAPAGA